MGWSKRSSGNRYDSLSGHPLAIGVLTKSILVAIVSSKLCRLCSLAESDNQEPPNYCCSKNYDGTSKAMEADVALQLYILPKFGKYKNYHEKGSKPEHIVFWVRDILLLFLRKGHNC